MKVRKLKLGDAILPPSMAAITNVNYHRLDEMCTAVVELKTDQEVIYPSGRFVLAYIDEVSNWLTFVTHKSSISVRRHAFIEAARSTNSMAIYTLNEEQEIVCLTMWEHWTSTTPLAER